MNSALMKEEMDRTREGIQEKTLDILRKTVI
jgi:hypothetical protein